VHDHMETESSPAALEWMLCALGPRSQDALERLLEECSPYRM